MKTFAIILATFVLTIWGVYWYEWTIVHTGLPSVMSRLEGVYGRWNCGGDNWSYFQKDHETYIERKCVSVEQQ